MIDFIICDDKKMFLKKICNIIDKVMINNDLVYKKHLFYDYNEEFIKIVNSKMSFKIYILDIEMPSNSGIEMAKLIRKEDTDSIIIFFTAYYRKYLEEILSNYFMFLKFIDKSKDYENALIDSINYAIHNLNKKNVIKFKSQNILYKLQSKDILYIFRDKDRKCNIKTDFNNISINMNLSDIYKLLDDRFVYSYRSCIVNTDRIKIYDKTNKIIIFDNGDKINLVSSRFKMK